MDPVASIMGYLAGSRSEKREFHAALRGWYAAKGFRPLLVDVDAGWRRVFGKGLTAAQRRTARMLGATGGG